MMSMRPALDADNVAIGKTDAGMPHAHAMSLVEGAVGAADAYKSAMAPMAIPAPVGMAAFAELQLDADAAMMPMPGFRRG